MNYELYVLIRKQGAFVGDGTARATVVLTATTDVAQEDLQTVANTLLTEASAATVLSDNGLTLPE